MSFVRYENTWDSWVLNLMSTDGVICEFNASRENLGLMGFVGLLYVD